MLSLIKTEVLGKFTAQINGLREDEIVPYLGHCIKALETAGLDTSDLRKTMRFIQGMQNAGLDLTAKSNDLPVPMDLNEAASMGRSLIYSFLKLQRKEHPELPHMSERALNHFKVMGEEVALGMYCECAPWTLDEFRARVGSKGECLASSRIGA